MVKPWYFSYKDYLITATALLESLVNRLIDESDKGDEDGKGELIEFFNDLTKEYFTKFIFESNNIEKEGLAEGETKKLVFDLFKDEELNDFLYEFQEMLYNVKYEIIPTKRFDPNKINLDDIELAVKYKGKLKDINLVMNSFSTLMTAREQYMDYVTNYLPFLKNNVEKVNTDELGVFGVTASRLIRYFKNKKDDGNYLISEEIIKKLHKILSEEMDNNENGAPGEYRPEPAYVNSKTVFMEPALIEKSMQTLIDNYERRFKKKCYNPFIEACKFTGDFIIIHPFGDFNGRIARILLNMILQMELVPFYIILRSNRSEKRKYITSMKHYYQGRPNTYLALVCKLFIDQIDSINSRLKMAGIEPIVPIELTDKQLKCIEEDLKEYSVSSLKFKKIHIISFHPG